jgi:twitching motility protein PilT
MLESHPNISDFIITVDKPLQVDSAGQLVPVTLRPPFEKLTPFQTEIFALNLINRDHRLMQDLLKEGACDLSYELPGVARFRVNIFSQLGNYSIVLRKLESIVPSCAELGLPEAYYRIAREKNGIVLITGATGTGKTTSLAAIINEINEHSSLHVVTLEDPVEYTHPQKQSTINQRELGKDFDTFVNGLRAAMRQAPKVILVGEMRDRESVEIALNAAETGHLVLSTLHTIDAGQTINRIIGMFPRDEENQIRLRLADAVRWIACQRLLPKEGGGRVAAFEVVSTSLRVKDVILHGESEGKTFHDIITQGKAFGMMTFDDCIITLFSQGIISENTAIAYSTNRAIVNRGLDMVKKTRGEQTTTLGSLEVDRAYGKKKPESWK